MASTPDAAFRRGIRERDKDAWDRLAVLYHAALCRQARLILPPQHDPENAVGDVWLKALKAARRYDPRRDPYPWLARICVNTCLNQRRGLLRRFAERIAGEPTAPAGGKADPGAVVLLRAALGKLTRGEREVLTLRYLFGVSVDEIAQVLDRKKHAIQVRLGRALEHLRAVWADGGELEARLAGLAGKGRAG